MILGNRGEMRQGKEGSLRRACYQASSHVGQLTKDPIEEHQESACLGCSMTEGQE